MSQPGARTSGHAGTGAASGRPPPRDGVSPSRVCLPQGPWRHVLDALVALFPAVGRDAWHARMARGDVTVTDGVALGPDAMYRAGLELHYFREVAHEAAVPFEEIVLHADRHLVVVDKPHFLAVMPGGRHVRETLLARLVRRLGNPSLVPLHRLDRMTAGLVMFSAHPGSRDAYHALFRTHAIDKAYEAVAPPLPDPVFPLVHRSRIERGEPFHRMCESAGPANSETRIDVLERGDACWRYRLQPATGRKHQLRVHMAALGAPILHDTLYPRLLPDAGEGGEPLQLLARALAFEDPLTGEARTFRSDRAFSAWPTG